MIRGTAVITNTPFSDWDEIDSTRIDQPGRLAAEDNPYQYNCNSQDNPSVTVPDPDQAVAIQVQPTSQIERRRRKKPGYSRFVSCVRTEF